MQTQSSGWFMNMHVRVHMFSLMLLKWHLHGVKTNDNAAALRDTKVSCESQTVEAPLCKTPFTNLSLTAKHLRVTKSICVYSVNCLALINT